MLHFNRNNIDHDGAGMPLVTGAVIDRTAEAVESLVRNPVLLGEVGLSDAEAVEMAAAIKGGDDLAMARIFRAATLRHIHEQMGAREYMVNDESDYDRAMELVRIYA